jgi:hypothetical protein
MSDVNLPPSQKKEEQIDAPSTDNRREGINVAAAIVRCENDYVNETVSLCMQFREALGQAHAKEPV